MSEDLKICLHCGIPFAPLRKTKKYCSDNCKLSAFYKSKGPDETSEDLTGTGNTEEEDVLRDLSENPDTKPIYNGNGSGQLPFNVKLTNKQQNDKKTTGSGYRYALPLPVTLNDKEHTGYYEPGEEPPGIPEKSPAAHRTAYSGGTFPTAGKAGRTDITLNDKNRSSDINLLALNVKENNRLTLTDEPDRKKKEDPYRYIHSEFVDDIFDYLNTRDDIAVKFQYPDKYFYDTDRVKWVSVRLRCLIENILHFADNVMNTRHLILLRDAFHALINSSEFAWLTDTYPFKAYAKELEGSLDKMIGVLEKKKRFLLTISREKKIILIATRYMLADLVPAARFYDLDFSK